MDAIIPLEDSSITRDFGNSRRVFECRKEGRCGAKSAVETGDAARLMLLTEAHSLSASPSPFSSVSDAFLRKDSKILGYLRGTVQLGNLERQWIPSCKQSA